jgi:hypothetical protein
MVVYVLDAESDGKWIVTKALVHARKKPGRQKGNVYQLKFNGFADTFDYPKSDVFRTRREARLEGERRGNASSSPEDE